MAAATTLGAITALFDADPTLRGDFASSGGLWVGGVPEDRQGLPQAVLLDFHEAPDWTFEDAHIDKGEFTLTVFAVGLAAAEALAAHIMAVFDPTTAAGGGFVPLSIVNSTSAWLERQDYRVRPVEYRTADQTWVYAVELPYATYVTRTPPS